MVKCTWGSWLAASLPLRGLAFVHGRDRAYLKLGLTALSRRAPAEVGLTHVVRDKLMRGRPRVTFHLDSPGGTSGGWWRWVTRSWICPVQRSTRLSVRAALRLRGRAGLMIRPDRRESGDRLLGTPTREPGRVALACRASVVARRRALRAPGPPLLIYIVGPNRPAPCCLLVGSLARSRIWPAPFCLLVGSRP